MVPRQFGSIVAGVFTPVLAKHSKSFSLIDCISVGVDRMQRNSEPMRKQVETWPRSELTDVTAKVVITEWPTLSLIGSQRARRQLLHDLGQSLAANVLAFQNLAKSLIGTS